MPYFWESESWKHRLRQHGILCPPPSGYAFSDYMLQRDLVNNPWNISKLLSDISTQAQNDGVVNIPKNSTLDMCTNFLKIMSANAKEMDFIEHLCNVLNLSKNESILEALVKKPGVGRVVITEEIILLRGLIEQFLDDVSMHIRQTNSAFGFSPALTGSMAETTRAGYGDEYDFRIDLNIESNDIYQFIPIDNSLTVLHEEIQRGSLQYIKEFYNSFTDTIAKLKETQNQSPLRYLCHGFSNSGIMYICFRRLYQNENMLVKVDIVPSIPMPGVLPSDQTKDPCGAAIKRNSHIILKYDQSMQSAVPVWSMCSAEQPFIQNLPESIKYGLILAKIIIGPMFFEGMMFMSLTCLPNFSTSYHLKNSLFECIYDGLISCDIDQDVFDIDLIFKVARLVLCHFTTNDCKLFFRHGKVIKNERPKHIGETINNLLNELWDQHVSVSSNESCEDASRMPQNYQDLDSNDQGKEQDEGLDESKALCVQRKTEDSNPFEFKREITKVQNDPLFPIEMLFQSVMNLSNLMTTQPASCNDNQENKTTADMAAFADMSNGDMASGDNSCRPKVRAKAAKSDQLRMDGYEKEKSLCNCQRDSVQPSKASMNNQEVKQTVHSSKPLHADPWINPSVQLMDDKETLLQDSSLSTFPSLTQISTHPTTTTYSSSTQPSTTYSSITQPSTTYSSSTHPSTTYSSSTHSSTTYSPSTHPPTTYSSSPSSAEACAPIIPSTSNLQNNPYQYIQKYFTCYKDLAASVSNLDRLDAMEEPERSKQREKMVESLKENMYKCKEIMDELKGFYQPLDFFGVMNHFTSEFDAAIANIEAICPECLNVHDLKNEGTKSDNSLNIQKPENDGAESDISLD